MFSSQNCPIVWTIFSKKKPNIEHSFLAIFEQNYYETLTFQIYKILEISTEKCGKNHKGFELIPGNLFTYRFW